ncbi:peptidase C14, caspase catalytic subunit p20 [bacterium]|nr:peptidase C14, caspase catalytic subunit p20 [bacterium]
MVLLTPLQAMAAKVALVIGMGAYQHVVQLKNTVNDARNVGAKLEQVGFKVTYAIDATQTELLDTMQTFSFDAETADIALIYYAGHGVEASGENYLIPVDAEVKSNKDVQRVGVSLAQMLKVVEAARKMRIVILDACRNNPFGDLIDTTVKADPVKSGTDSRSTGPSGLAPVNPDLGTLVAFAAKEGQVALDGAGGDSPFALALMHALVKPDLEISLMFRQVRDEVLKETGNLQEPYTYGSLSGTPYYLAGTADGGTDVAQVADPRVAWADVKPDQEQQLRALADQGDTRSMIGLAYIRQNPNDSRYNPAEAVQYFTRAANAGAPDAEFELAKIYEQGLGVPPDPAKALELYKASAAQGFADAINDLGFLYFQGGLGLQPDQAKGIEYFRQAADLRHPEAMFNYAGMIDNGAIPGKGPADAAKYLYQALRAGSEDVMTQLTTNADSFTPKTRAALQKLLKDHQFYTGKTDGKFNPATVAAIRMAYGLKG